HEIGVFRVGAEGLTSEGTIATGIEVYDVLVDPEAARVYATDSHGQLHVLQLDEDWAHLDPVATLEGRGLLTLDPQHGRLYVAQDPGPTTYVYDTYSLERIASVAMGGAIAVDPGHDRWFLGHEVLGLAEEDLYPTVQVFAWNAEGTAFEKVARIPQPGMPVYNPLRDELYIVNDTAHVVDTSAWQVVGELLPGFTSPSIRRCNGCRIISDVTVLPERDLLLVHVWPISAGKGAGLYPSPIALRASTLEPITPTVTILSSACGAPVGSMPGRRAERLVVAADPVAGRTYENRIYSRYVSFHNVWVYQGGQPVDWLDGLAFALVAPVYRHALAPVGDSFLVLDLED
ncbi:MAG: hypothetical protein H5T59_14955, partial [Anaerolineae bacterium]|nr:hypothetical protein [Anaerolineae bacterium]